MSTQRRWTAGLLVAIIVGWAAAWAGEAAGGNEIAEIEKKAAAVTSYQADVAMKTNVMGQQVAGQGKMVFKKPGKSWTEMDTNMGAMVMKQVIYSNGKTLWTHQPTMNMVTKIDLAALGQATGVPTQQQQSADPASALQGLQRESLVLLGTADVEGVKCYGFEGTPQPVGNQAQMPFMPATMRLWFGVADGMLRKMAALDKDGAEQMSMSYSNLKTNIDVPDDRFEFTPPAGMQVMDMTEGAKAMMKQFGGQAKPAPAAPK